MSENVQSLPPGLAGRAAAATTAPAPSAYVAPVDQGPVAVPGAPVTAPAVEAPTAPPVNPMLSHVSQPKPDAAPAPVDLNAAPPAVPTLEPVKVPGTEEPKAQTASVSRWLANSPKIRTLPLP